MLYLSLKWLHLVAVISWMAALFYMPRLFVYHSKAGVGGEASETFKVMEHKLSKIIMTPAMVVTWIAGLGLLHVQQINPAVSHWMALKLLAVLAMSWLHFKFLSYKRQFNADARPKSEKFFRAINEGPTLLMFAIIYFVVFKPAF